MSGKNILFLVLLLHQYYPYFCDKVKIKKNVNHSYVSCFGGKIPW